MLGFLLIAVAILASSSYGLTQNNDHMFALGIDRFSYCPSKLIPTHTDDWSLIGVYDPLSRQSTQALVVQDTDDDELFVSFRGTQRESIPQWASNLEVEFDKWTEGRVHRGFHERFLEVRDRVMKWVDESSVHSVTLSGHSMGGAVATLMASYLRSHRPDKAITLITFGSPRVGDRAFVEFVDRQLGDHISRIMNKYDMVAEVPPKALGYRHVGRLYVCDDGGGKCQTGQRMEENQGGLLMALKRTIETMKNVGKWHLTYLGQHTSCPK